MFFSKRFQTRHIKMRKYVIIFFIVFAITIEFPVKSLSISDGRELITIRELNQMISNIEDQEKKAQFLGKLGNLYLKIQEPEKALKAYRESDQNHPSQFAKVGKIQSLKQIIQKTTEELALIKETNGTMLTATSMRNLEKLVKKEEQAKLDEQTQQIAELKTLINNVIKNGNQRQKIIAILAGQETKLLEINWKKLINDIDNLPNPKPYLIQLAKQNPEATKEIIKTPQSSIEIQLLSNFYYQKGNLEKARTLAYQSFNKQKEKGYSIFWLIGKIENDKGNLETAVAYYKRAERKIKEQKFSLIQRKQIEGFYREFLKLLIKQERFKEALKVNKQLKIRGLENYLGFPCAFLDNQNIKHPSNQDLIINTIIFDEETHVIAQYPDQQIKHYTINLSQKELNLLSQEWQKDIYNILEPLSDQTRGKRLYKLLIEPLEIKNQNIRKLIFNNDKILRNIPMAALYDGNKYLIEKYEISLTLGLSLSQGQFNQKSLDALLVGISKPKKGIPLPNVKMEIQEISKLIKDQTLMNQQFTTESFVKQLEKSDYNTLHIASHGIFGGTSDTSFLLAYDRALSITELITILSNNQINLLVLSACESATGNSRSLLGMAGIGTQIGIKTTIGTLWTLQDSKETVEIMTAFYQGIIEGDSESKALAVSIIKQIEKNTHISNWASPVIIEN